MGRTNPTFRAVIDGTEQRWQDYRRALRHRDTEAFDDLFTHTRAHADAAGLLNHEEPLFPMLVSINLEQQKRLNDIEERLEQIEADSDT
ncbi:hypothetical protein [Natronomonas sp.]|uniref:hypothetical protein n=1 Tax=Natronomonas sp. TaxID=2184060 RepID=UPI002FC38B08